MPSTLNAVALAAVAWALSGALPVSAQTAGSPVRIEAWAVNMSNIGTGQNSIVQIDVDRWSTDAERDELVTTFAEKGPDALLRTLQNMKRVGFIRLPTTLGYDLRFARRRPLDDGGEQIIIATDRRIGFWEARNQPRTIDYPFTLMEIRVDKEGKGEGKLALATKISYNKKNNTVELENYSSEAVRLQNVKLEPKK